MSKNSNRKESAIKLRKNGKSIRDIEAILHINRSTLSGWLKNVKLTEKQKIKLHNNWLNALVEARKKAIITHNKKKHDRKKIIKQDIEKLLPKINIDKNTLELILATFYLAEGGKTENNFALANSNPELLKGIITLLRKIFALDESKFRCCLHLRKDQNEEIIKDFWSKILDIPQSKFLKTQFDKRTIKKTYEHYKGVCVILYYDIALQRRLLFLGKKLLKIINHSGV